MSETVKTETQRAVANALNVSTESLRLYRKIKGAPAGWNVEEWREFIQRQGLAKASSATLSELKVELMRRDIELRDLKIQRARADVIDREVVEEMLGALAQKLDLLLRLKLEVELGARVAGKSAAEANVEGTLMLDEIREVINANIARFETDAVKQQSTTDDAEPE